MSKPSQRRTSPGLGVRIATLVALGLAAMALAPAAWAGQPVSLRRELTSSGSITLADLFEVNGAVGAVVVGNGAPVGLSAVLDAGEVQRIAHVHGLDWDNPSGIRRVIVLSAARSMGGGAGAPAGRMSDTLTYARNLATGEIVQPQDIVFAKVPSFTLPADAPRDAEDVIGKMARRPLRSGAPVAAHDVATAQVIKRDDVIQVAYHADGISLVLQAKAMAAASLGEPLSVMNTASKRVFQAIAVGPDQAVVGPDADRVRESGMADPTEYAVR
jgi:flagella basal body P-ring formation protein FlgA